MVLTCQYLDLEISGFLLIIALKGSASSTHPGPGSDHHSNYQKTLSGYALS